MSLASKTSPKPHFEVLCLGLEAPSPRKLACPQLEDSTILWIVKILWSAWKIFWKTFFCGDRLKNFCEDLFFWRALALVSLALASSIPVLGLESVCPRKGCPWPWRRIFLCPWPWPRALFPRLHLWRILSEKKGFGLTTDGISIDTLTELGSCTVQQNLKWRLLLT